MVTVEGQASVVVLSKVGLNVPHHVDHKVVRCWRYERSREEGVEVHGICGNRLLLLLAKIFSKAVQRASIVFAGRISLSKASDVEAVGVSMLPKTDQPNSLSVPRASTYVDVCVVTTNGSVTFVCLWLSQMRV